MRASRLLSTILSAVLFATLPILADDILFDATKHEMAGNADWVIDAQTWDLSMTVYPCTGTKTESNPQQIPLPAQSGITGSTPETYWDGAISAWAVELAKAGHTVETLPPGGRITWGDGTNAQDLSHYQLFVVVEPQNAFSPAEKSAILAFVNAGGGLFMVGDHETSDRDCDGLDSPNIWNAFTGATSGSSAGLFGIWMRVDGLGVNGEDWFDDGVDNNVSTDPADPIIHGPFGDGTGGLGFFGATSMDINPAIATAHVWRTGQAHNEFRVTFVTATYGGGRVAAIGDSSPADDGTTGDPNDTVYDGWDKAVGGVNNKEIHLNACHWLMNPTPDTTPPSITAGPSATPSDCSASIVWTTDENATSVVEYGLTLPYGSTQTVAGYSKSHSVVLTGLATGTAYHYRVSSTDTSGNGPTVSEDGTFTSTAATPPTITAGPSAAAISGAGATLTWTTDEAASSSVEYGLTAGYGSSASSPGLTTAHAVPVSGLTPETIYHYRVLSTDGCGNGPTASTDATFTTGPASLDISGWQLRQFNSSLTYTFPAGTTVPSGGYLVVARNATRAQFQAFFPAFPAAAVFLNSNASGSCANGCLPVVNGGQQFELYNGATMVDGRTIAMAENNAYQRTTPGAPAGVAGSWTTVPEANANPGTGAGTPSGAGVRINEMADASDYTKEFVELFYDATAPPADTTAPDAVSDLAALALSDSQIRLTWTAPGDDGSTGTAAAYDVRRSLAPITTDVEFSAATQVAGLSAPQGAGSTEQFVVSGLTGSTTHHFAIKTRDEVPNWSGLSNGASAMTPATPVDATPPSAVSNLTATPLSDTQVRLDWTSPGDDGMTGTPAAYDVRWDDARILTEADWAGAAQLTGIPAAVAGGTARQMTVTNLAQNTSYYFALKTRDEVPNWSALSNCASATTGLTGGTPPVNHLVISQFSVAGGTDDRVEIYNPTASSISLTGYSLRNLSDAGNQGFAVSLSGTISAHGWVLVAGSGYTGTPTADLSLGSNNFSKDAGHILILNRTGTPPTTCADAAVVDKVGYAAAATCPEGGTGKNTGLPLTTQSVSRKPGGTVGNGQDTDVNSDDFLAPGIPAYHNASNTPATPPASLGNVGQTLFLMPSVSGTDLDWASAAGATAYRLYRGTAPDFMTTPPAPQVVTSSASVDATLPTPALYYVVRATDGTNESTD